MIHRSLGSYTYRRNWPVELLLSIIFIYALVSLNKSFNSPYSFERKYDIKREFNTSHNGDEPLLVTTTNITEEELVRPHVKRKPEILVVITPAGGLTNIKQRIFGAVTSSAQKYVDRDVRFAIPWLPVQPNWPYVPFDTVFNPSFFLAWMENSGFKYFNESWIFDEKGSDDWRDDWKIYFEILRNWATSSNVTLVKVIGELVPIEPEYGISAFVLQDKILEEAGISSNYYGCVVHARIEQDWQKYRNGFYYVPLNDILASIDGSKLCHGKILTFLTGSENELKQACHSCLMANKTSLNYIQNAAVDFHIGVHAQYFTGNMQSSLSRLIMLSKGFNGTFTYSKLGESICIRRVTPPSIRPKDHQLTPGIVTEKCVVNGTF